MKLNHLILEKLYHLFGANFNNNSNFRILNIHDILEKDFDNLEKILVSLKKNWEFIDPTNLNKIKSANNKNYILLTFDDGYKSQKIFVDKVLNKHGIKAIFFVVTNFLDCVDKNSAKSFVLKNIDDKIYENKERYEEVDNMNFDDISELKYNNHLIGSHTVNHKKLTTINNLEELEFEIYNSKKKLENILNCTVDNFAYTYGDIGSINNEVINCLKRQYKNIFSGIRGNNFLSKSNLIFLRDEVSPSYSQSLVNSFLYGYSDFYYYMKRKKLFSFENDI